jgi:hypothetical protein
MGIINLEDWLVHEQEGAYGAGTDLGNVPAGPPQTDPNIPQMTPAASPQGDPNIANLPTQQPPTPQMPDVAQEPQVPDMPEKIGGKELDFEQWKKEFIVESITGDVEKLKSMILDVRDRDLDPYQRKFVEDNLNIIFLREQSNIDKASKEIRKLIKEDLDHNNPGSSLANHITSVLNEMPLLNAIFVKLTGLLSAKSDYHRKFIASLTGSVQVGNGAFNEDLIFNEKDYSIRISTRFNSRFGEVHIGQWNLKSDDPERYLKAPELKRLEDGAPEEKDVLRKRIIIESIAETYKTRSFFINVVGTDGTVYTIGLDLATSIKSGYNEGNLVVRLKENDSMEAMIDDDGTIISFPEVKIMFVEETGHQDAEGNPEKIEVEFISQKHGQLYLTAQLPIIKKASTSFQGMNFKQMPWQGNPSDLRTLSRCVPSLPEIILRNC